MILFQIILHHFRLFQIIFLHYSLPKDLHFMVILHLAQNVGTDLISSQLQNQTARSDLFQKSGLNVISVKPREHQRIFFRRITMGHLSAHMPTENKWRPKDQHYTKRLALLLRSKIKSIMVRKLYFVNVKYRLIVY